ncbi:MAG: hypothetical protein HY983_04595 [Candidatus Magasanikbacteria bacterium]|nr:hypothetical protein [Candidatus Magasanikbacteria bacterium]
MALSDFQQISQIASTSQHVLVLFNARDNGDAIGSALALSAILQKQGKQVDVACSDFTVPKSLAFLPKISEIKPELGHLQKFIIKVDVSKNPIDTISYDVKDGTLSLYLTPKSGLLSKHELRTAQSTFKYDLIITLNMPDLESLGSIFLNNTDLFYRTTIVNIDHQASNERYGQVNLIDLTATSTSEIVYTLIKQIGEQHLNADVATALLTGMTIATKSFKNPNITPVTLQIASALVSSGADREKVVRHLYRTRSIAALKLWGQALTHLVYDQRVGLVSTTITREDFARSGATADELKGMIDELFSTAPEAKVTLILYEEENQVCGLLATEKNSDALLMVKPLSPHGNKRQCSFEITGKTLKEAEEMVLSLLKKTLVSF